MDINILNLNGADSTKEVKQLPKEVTSVFSTNEIEDYKEVFSLFDPTQTGFIRLIRVPRILLEVDGDIDKEALGEIMEEYVNKKIKKVDLNNFLIIAAKAHKEIIEAGDVLRAFDLLNPIGVTMILPKFRQMMQNTGDPLDDKEMTLLINKAVQQHDKYFNYEMLVYKLTAQMEEYERIIKQRERARKVVEKSDKKQVKLPPIKPHAAKKSLRPGALKHFDIEEDKDYEDIDTEETEEKTEDEVMKKLMEDKEADEEFEIVDLAQEKEEQKYEDVDDDDDDDDYDDDDDDDNASQLRIYKTHKQANEQEEVGEEEEEEEGEEEIIEEVGEEELEEESSEEDDYEDTDKYESEDCDEDVTEYEIPSSLLPR